MWRSYHIGDSNSQPEAQPPAQHSEDEYVSQLAHCKNALFSSGAFLRTAFQDWDAESTKKNCP